MTTVNAFVARHPVAAYFALTFAISWGGVLLAIGGFGGMSEPTPTSDPRFIYAFLAMLAGPSVAGVLLTGVVHGRAGLRDVLARATTWRVGVRWYAVALLTAPLLMSVTLFALSLISPAFLPGLFTTDDRGALLLVGLAVGLGAGIFEELGWTGFAIPALRRRHTVLTTGIVVGVVWGAWHLLTNVFWASSASAGELPLSIFLPVSVVGVLIGYLPAFRMLMVWVYDRTGSVFVAMLMHVSLTASLLMLNPVGISGTTLLIVSFTLAAAVWAVVAAVTVAGRRQRRFMSPSRRAA
jgi:membrane protease YdiL (CAAX protease family)